MFLRSQLENMTETNPTFTFLRLLEPRNKTMNNIKMKQTKLNLVVTIEEHNSLKLGQKNNPRRLFRMKFFILIVHFPLDTKRQ